MTMPKQTDSITKASAFAHFPSPVVPNGGGQGGGLSRGIQRAPSPTLPREYAGEGEGCKCAAPDSIFRSAKHRYSLLRRGSAIIEGAFVLIVLLTLSFGTIEFGYFFFVKHSIEGAAREGARAAIPANATNADVTTAIANSMNAAGLQSAKSHYVVSISNSASDAPPTQKNVATMTEGQPVYVTVECDWSDVGLGLGIISQSKVLKSVTVMRKEGS